MRWYVVVLAVVIVAAALAVVLMVRHTRTDKYATQRAALVSQAVDVLDPLFNKDLAPIVKNLQGLPGYDKDPDSLYVITQYYINNSDGKNVKTYYDKLVKAYGKGYSNPKLQHAPSPADLKAQVEFIENQGGHATTINPGPTQDQIEKSL